MSNTKKLTQSALLLALCVIFQNLRLFPVLAEGPLSQFVIGSLVNLTIFLAVGKVGIQGALAIALLAPMIAFFQGHLRFPVFVPIVAIGNMLPPLIWHFFNIRKKQISQFIAVILGSITKFLFLRLTIPLAFSLFVAPVPPAPIIWAFSYPQLITALIGGIGAIIILRVLPKNA